jgi:hypothetical protein
MTREIICYGWQERKLPYMEVFEHYQYYSVKGTLHYAVPGSIVLHPLQLSAGVARSICQGYHVQFTLYFSKMYRCTCVRSFSLCAPGTT